MCSLVWRSIPVLWELTRGLTTQRQYDEQSAHAILNVSDASGHDYTDEQWHEYYDDNTGEKLEHAKVIVSRAAEVNQHGCSPVFHVTWLRAGAYSP